MDMKQIRALILDADGVVWRDNDPIGDLAAIFEQVKGKSIRYCFATNNSTKSRAEYESRFRSFGVPISPAQIFTSGIATAEILQKHFPSGGNIFVIGMKGLIDTLEEHGFRNEPSNPLAVVVGLDNGLTYEKLETATLLIRSGVPFIGTNGDRTFPTPLGLAPGAGSILAALIASTDTNPEIIGKPEPTMFHLAKSYLDASPEEILVIGDRLETDIRGGQAAGCKTALVLSGVSTRAESEMWQPQPDIIANNLSEVVGLL